MYKNATHCSQFINAFIKAVDIYKCNGTEGIFIPKHEIERLLFLAERAMKVTTMEEK